MNVPGGSIHAGFGGTAEPVGLCFEPLMSGFVPYPNLPGKEVKKRLLIKGAGRNELLHLLNLP